MINAIMSLLGTILYPLFAIFFILIDGIQALFQAFAGTGKIRYGGVGVNNSSTVITGDNTGAETDTGIVYYLFQSELIKNLFMSILILALFLIIIFTVMAFIKNAYSAKSKKWQEIVGNAFIGLANFIFIPVCCLLGVWLGNILLKAIDGATNISGAATMSRQLFLSAAYNANEFRCKDGDATDLSQQEAYDGVVGIRDYWAEKGADVTEIEIIQQTWTTQGDEDHQAACEYYAQKIDEIYGSTGVDIYSYWSVSDWYQLWSINYLVLIGGGAFILYALGSITFGMVKRMFTLLMLFVISPALCALYPLDDGKAVGSWKGDFIKNTISAYGAVAGLNLFFSIAPIIQNIKLFGSGGIGAMMDALGLTSLLLTICGLFVVKDFISMISGYIGAGNAYADGSSLMSSVNKKTGLGNLGKGSIKAFGKASGAFGAAEKGGRMKAFGGSMLKSSRDGGLSLLKSATGMDFTKEGRRAFAEAMKEGETGVKTVKAQQKYKDLLQKYDNEKDATKQAEIMRQIVSHIEKNGLGDKYMEKTAKKRGVTLEQFKEEIENAKQLKAKEKAIAYAQANQTQLNQYLDDIANAQTKTGLTNAMSAFEMRFGKNLQDIADELFGGNAKQAARSIKAGQMMPEEIRERQIAAAQTDAEKLRVQQSFDSFNSLSQQFMQLKTDVTTARTGLADFYESLNEKVFKYTSDGKREDKPIKIEDKDMAQMRSEIISGLEVTNKELAQAIKDNADNSKKAYENLLREQKQVLSDWKSQNKGKDSK